MTIPYDWLYPPSLEAAAVLQKQLAIKIVTTDQFEKIEYIGGMDVSNNPYDPAQMIYANLVVLDKEYLVRQQVANISMQQNFPYITGFLGFREAPALVSAWEKIKLLPQIIMVDGHGISHPRGLGVASHIGVLLDIPTIGVAKTILVGKLAGELGPNPGDQVPLIWKGNQIATVLRTKLRSNPLIISTGHRVSLVTAVDLVMQCLRGYRLPEPTRQAHLAANEFRRSSNLNKIN